MHPTERDSALYSPLGEEVRKERRALLVASIIAIAIGASGIVPTRITTLGIEFSSGDRIILLRIVALVILYLTFAFVLHAVLDGLDWHARYRAEIERLEADLRSGAGDTIAIRHRLELIERVFRRPSMLVLVGLFELGLPLATAVAALIALAYANL
ncbi:MAG TPA: hypothetical protein VF746_12510 [Longimicrobium sp.]